MNFEFKDGKQCDVLLLTHYFLIEKMVLKEFDPCRKQVMAYIWSY